MNHWQVVQPAVVPHHPLIDDGVVHSHHYGLPINVDLISAPAQEEPGRSIEVTQLDMVAVTVVYEGPGIRSNWC